MIMPSSHARSQRNWPVELHSNQATLHPYVACIHTVACTHANSIHVACTHDTPQRLYSEHSLHASCTHHPQHATCTHHAPIIRICIQRILGSRTSPSFCRFSTFHQHLLAVVFLGEAGSGKSVAISHLIKHLAYLRCLHVDWQTGNEGRLGHRSPFMQCGA